MDKLNLAVTINKQRKDKKGRCQVRIRTTVKRKVSYHGTGISVLEEQFKNGEIIKHPNKTAYNIDLRNQLHEIENNFLNGVLKIRGKVDFYDYSTKKIAKTKSKDSHGTWKHKRSYLSKVHSFAPNLAFSEITPSFMLDFENHCRSKKNKPTTVWSSVKFIKTMVNSALNDGVITANPMKGYKSQPYVNPERSFLTDKELQRIEKFAATSKSETLVKVANWFLFGCYSGLRYADVRDFNKKKIIGGRIILRTGKSNTDVSIKLHPKLKAILDKISPNVFTNQKVNDYLKSIADKCKIHKTVTFHVSRHTYSVYFLNHGGTLETLSKLLGHSSTKTTSIYGKITNVRIDKEISEVFGR